MKYSKEEVSSFYSTLLNDVFLSDVKEVIEHITKDNNNPDFYILCQKFVDIALNAKKYFDEKANSVIIFNNDEDIDEAAKVTNEFVKKYKISQPEKLLDMIEKRFPCSVSASDERQKAGLVPVEKSKASKGVTDKFYSFLKIAAWDDTKKRILEYIELSK